jgi:hypothetical protein
MTTAALQNSLQFLSHLGTMGRGLLCGYTAGAEPNLGSKYVWLFVLCVV